MRLVMEISVHFTDRWRRADFPGGSDHSHTAICNRADFLNPILIPPLYILHALPSAHYICLTCWPSPATWDDLNTTLTNHLLHPHPAASVCYPSNPTYNLSLCSTILSNWPHSSFHSSDPLSIDDPFWANNSCNPLFPNGTSITGNIHAEAEGCTRGKYPVYVINATEVGHVQTGLRFAREWGVRVNVKNTGHGAEGSELGGGLSYTQCVAGLVGNGTIMAATLGAGVQDGEMFAALAKYNAIADVGVVGWATGGGHGLATGNNGMGADNIIAAEICHSDLFWAIRGGGGGGTYGVIGSVTVKAYPMPQVTMINLSLAARNGTSDRDWYRVVAHAHQYLVDLQDHGVHGYYVLGGPPLAMNGALLLYDAKNGTAERLLQPFWDFLKRYESIVDSTIMPSSESIGTMQSARASRFIPRRAVEDDVELFAHTLQEIMSRKDSPEGVSTPSISGTMTGSRIPVDNALNPAWRDSVVHWIVSQSWNQSIPVPVAEQVVYNMTYGKGYALRQLAPDTGCYLNEANPYEPDWQSSLFGAHYPRLLSVKSRYDPDELLWCRHWVGSEAWVEQEDGRLCSA
ncbi:uncharacterized protein BO80DRAFT_479249 [Aspergillus ibericus CBS 121593]|uniref:Berberine/berberine-like domain-containing protein n=1 Tax=Aspergillus ibericus CBS 121593 TaxID=1448316 RepID=A0A395GT52_9EURO|nr:hypothetical protein BO80DRAFT_479249 [Aspergillus ibericus CBS 121593]RAK98770.1 hypothetical protein BO80DRAFT_479249 [Aspergillus ibericus CBS 121593]